MSKAVLISIRPKWCQKIVNEEKTIEIRKTRPRLDTPFKCYIYCTLPRNPHEDFLATDYPRPQFYGGGKVIGEFTCDQIVDAWWDYVPDAITREVTGGNLEELEGNGMTDGELFGYVGDSLRGHCYGWRISELKIYDKPKELGEFRRVCVNGLYCESCAMYRENDGTCGNESLHLKRPLQSWGYVENMEG